MFAIGNMKIGVRLGLVFGIGLLVLLVEATLGLKTTTSAVSLSSTMVENNRETDALTDAQSAIWALRWDIAQFVSVTDPKERKQIVDNQKKLQRQFADAIRIYQEGSRSAEESAATKELMDVFGKFAYARSKWFELYGSGKIKEASAFRADQLTPAGKSVVDVLGRLIKLQKKSAEAHGKETIDAMSQGRILLLWLSGLAVPATIVFAWILVQSITRPLKQAVAAAQQVAAGDLTNEMEITSRDELGQLLQALKEMTASLRNIVGEVRAGTEGIGTASKQIASGNADLSQRTEQQASSLEETASSMEELTATVMQNAENAKEANQLAAGASEVAVKGGQVVGQVVETMSSINESSKKIMDIISVIDGIAFQTNILALNAAVEAARAGEQGRGFAVVAMEVRALAQRSAAAAKEIKQLIGDSVHKVEVGTRLVDEAGKTMEEIVNAVKWVTDLMSEIAAASQEQSRGIEEVNQAITQMDQVTQQNAALVEEAAAAAESMQEQAQNLLQAVALFKLAESEADTVDPVRERRPEVPLPRTIIAHVPVRRSLGAAAQSARSAPKERRLGVARQPKPAAATPGDAAADEFENDHWTEL